MKPCEHCGTCAAKKKGGHCCSCGRRNGNPRMFEHIHNAGSLFFFGLALWNAWQTQVYAVKLEWWALYHLSMVAVMLLFSYRSLRAAERLRYEWLSDKFHQMMAQGLEISLTRIDKPEEPQRDELH